MRRIKTMPSQEDLHAAFDYSFVEGALYRRTTGKPVGSLSPSGYMRVCLNYVVYPRHRLVWSYFYGDPGCMLVDHINKDRADDRIENLRLATESENRRNSGMFCTNTSGYKGVTLERSTNRWKAYIYINNRRKHLGMFATAEEAAQCYAEASRKYHGDFAGELT